MSRSHANVGRGRRLEGVLLALTLLLASAPSGARQGGAPPAVTELRIRVTGESAANGASGVLTFPAQGRNAVLAVEAHGAAGQPAEEGKLAPSWSTSNPEVISIHGKAEGMMVRVVAQADGRADVTVKVGAKSASIPIYVGKERERITAAELTPAFRVARLELGWEPVALDDPDAVMRGRALMLGENGHAVVLKARAFAAEGTSIPLEDFPVTWATADASVAELLQTGEAQTHVVGREPGRTRVTATIQGVTLAVETFVGDRRQKAEPVLFGESASAMTAAMNQTVTRPMVNQSLGTPAASRTPGGTNNVTATTRPPGSPPPSERPGRQPGAAPTNVTASVSGVGEVTLRWTPPAGTNGYAISSAADAGGPFAEAGSAPAAASSHVVKDVRPGAIQFTVTANYPDRMSGESAPVSVTMPPAPQPKNFRASSGPGYVLLQWDAVPEAVGYTLVRQDGGAATSLDDHLPKRATPLLQNSSYMDTEGPAGRTVGYVLSAVYKDAEGREYEGDSAGRPRTPATPLPHEPGTSDYIRVTRYEISTSQLYTYYQVVHDSSQYGWISAVYIDQLQPSGWKLVNVQQYSNRFSRQPPPPGRPKSPGSETSSVMPVDNLIPLGCDNARVYRVRVEWSWGGHDANTPVRKTGERMSRPYSVTYDSPYKRCH